MPALWTQMDSTQRGCSYVSEVQIGSMGYAQGEGEGRGE